MEKTWQERLAEGSDDTKVRYHNQHLLSLYTKIKNKLNHISVKIKIKQEGRLNVHCK